MELKNSSKYWRYLENVIFVGAFGYIAYRWITGLGFTIGDLIFGKNVGRVSH